MHESAKGNSILLLGKTNGVSDSYTLHLKLVGKILNNKPIGPHFEWKIGGFFHYQVYQENYSISEYRCSYWYGHNLWHNLPGVQSWEHINMSRDKPFIPCQGYPTKYNLHQLWKYMHVKPDPHWPPPPRKLWLCKLVTFRTLLSTRF